MFEHRTWLRGWLTLSNLCAFIFALFMIHMFGPGEPIDIHAGIMTGLLGVVLSGALPFAALLALKPTSRESVLVCLYGALCLVPLSAQMLNLS